MLEIPSDPNNRLEPYFRSLEAARSNSKRHKPENRRNFLRTITAGAISGATAYLGLFLASTSLGNMRRRDELNSLRQKLDYDYKVDFFQEFTELAKETPRFLDLICYMKLLPNTDDEKRIRQLAENIRKKNKTNNDAIKFNAIIEGAQSIRQLFVSNDIDLEGINHFYKTNFLGLFRAYFRKLKGTSELCKEIVEKIKDCNDLAKLFGEAHSKLWTNEDGLIRLKEELCLTSECLLYYDFVAENHLNTIWKSNK